MRIAIRSLARRPVFSMAAILTIALGIGANTALFGVIYAILLQPLPFRDPGRLVRVWQTHPSLPQLQVTVPDFADWRQQSHSFEQISAYTLSAMNNTTLLGQGEPAAIHATMAGSDLFATMGIRPIAGRVFTEAEEHDKRKVALISESLWRRKFGGDPAVIGRQIRLQDDSFQVIGVVSRAQSFPEWADLWMPLSLIEPDLANRRKFHPLEVIARLRPGVTWQQAQSEMRSIAHNLAEAHPDTNATIGAFVIPLAQDITGAVRPALLLAWAAVGLVLLMACANVAHLFLARMVERRAELDIRSALGAGPWRLARQMMAEGLLVAVAGGITGIAAAAWTMQLLRGYAAERFPQLAWAGFDAPVWLFAASISLLGGLLFGLPAAWQILRRGMPLAAAGRSVVRGRSPVSAALMAGEVAIALLVLAGVALLARNFAELLAVDPGFRAQNVWTVPRLPLRNDGDQATAFLRDRLALELLRLPGVTAVSAVNAAPLSLAATEHSRFATRFGIEGRTFDPGSYPVTQYRWGAPDYLHTLGVPLVSGRMLDERDRRAPNVLINQTLAQRYFPGRDPVGQHLLLGVMDPQPSASQIVGVVGDVHDMGLDQDVEPTMYAVDTSPVMTLIVKTGSVPANFAGTLRQAIHRVDPELPVGTIQPLQQAVSESLARRRLALTLLAIFGAIAAFLTAAGIYGLMAQSVNARAREFGVRAAIGAEPGELVRMVLREALWLALPGLAAGVVLALAFARVMKSFVYRLSPADPVSISCAAAFLLALTFVSAWIPARRAAAADPATALRTE